MCCVCVYTTVGIEVTTCVLIYKRLETYARIGRGSSAMTSKQTLAIAIIFACLCCSTLYRVVRYHDTDKAPANERQERKSTTLAMLNVLKGRKHNVDVAATLSSPRRLDVDKDLTTENNFSTVTTMPSHSKIKHTPSASPRVKICVCALTRSKPTWKTLDDSRVMKNVIASTHRTTVMEWDQFEVQILLGADADDTFWQRHADALKQHALGQYELHVIFKFYPKHGNFLPFNDLMRDGYHTGSEYLVRINDDTEFTSNGWVSLGVRTLKSFQPPNVGVVGPSCAQGNTKILTHDMVHRTHLNIFKTYYPVVFHNWYLDDWISRVYGPARTKKIQSWTVVHHVEQQGQRYKEVMSDEQSLQRELDAGHDVIRNYLDMQSKHGFKMQVHVLTMKRSDSLKRLLQSLQNADYDGDTINLHIHIDKSEDNQECIRVARDFLFSHGTVAVDNAVTNRGLRDSWLGAWRPQKKEVALILEDDIDLSPKWYVWLKNAWKIYGNRMDLAGISLQRQTLIPEKPHKQEEIVNGHEPFLYKLIGSIGFSPHWKQWRDFLHWAESVDLSKVDINIPNLITSDWFNNLNKRHIWTQYFIYFCYKRDLYTMYVNLPGKKTLAAHMRERGEHFDKTEGRDFETAKSVAMQFPNVLSKYGWNGQLTVASTQQGQSSRPQLVTDGSQYGGWTYDISFLNSNSIVYSVGLGEDTSWDEGIMNRLGLHVWGFDPTPKSVSYVKMRSNLHRKEFYFTPEGLSIQKKNLTFTKPANPNHVSMRQGVHSDGGDKIMVPVNTLENWMKKHGHSYLDILKLDIEGSEYDVIENWIKQKKFPMNQLLIEFHQRFFTNQKRHEAVLKGLLTNGFEIIHDKNGQGVEMAFRKKLTPKHYNHDLQTIHTKTIPIVLTALNMKINKMLVKTLPFLCKNNNRVVVLTNVHQNKIHSSGCIDVVNISNFAAASMSELAWPRNAPKNQKVFFDRWYVLRDWMKRTGTNIVFVMDGDGIMTQNVTNFVHVNWNVFREHQMWIVYNPPRASWPFAFLTLSALQDVTNFWNQMFVADIWTSEFIGGTSPNDMIALGHYTHASVGQPYPCWGYGPKHTDGSCDDSIDYGHTVILNRLRHRNITARFTPGTLTLNQMGHSTFPTGIVDNNYKHDPIQMFNMQKKSKQLRFWKGIPQFQLRTRAWMSVWGYILEDEKEICVDNHIKLITSKSTCKCADFCCRSCTSQHIKKIKTTPFEKSSKNHLIDNAKKIQSKYGLVNIQILNHGYVQLTQSWICNVRRFTGILEKTLFIATDQPAYNELIQFDANLNIILLLYKTPKNLSYGQYLYYDFMLFRTRLVLSLIQDDITLWLTESDAIWFSDPSNIVSATDADMVIMSDAFPDKILNGGFLLLRPTSQTITVWTKLLKTFENVMKSTKSDSVMGDTGSEQLMLSKIIKGESRLKVRWLHHENFISGLFYQTPKAFKNPIVVLNNYIIGNTAKINRAKKFGHWFLNEDNKCSTNTALFQQLNFNRQKDLQQHFERDQKYSHDQMLGAVIVQAPPRNKGFPGYTLGSWGKRLCLFLHMIRSVDRHLNKALGTSYPIYVLVSSDPESDPMQDDAIYSKEDRDMIRSWAPHSNVFFVDIVMYTGEALSPGTNTEQISRWVNGKDGGIGGRSLGYRSMCRLWSGRLQMMPFLDNFEFYMRLDDDSFFTRDMDADPFHIAKHAGLDYLYIRKSDDAWGLQPLKKVATAHGTFKGNGLSPYTNFHLARVSIFRSKKFQNFWADLEAQHIFFKSRVGDALLHNVMLELFISTNRIKTMPKMPYAHNSNDYTGYPPKHWHRECPFLSPGYLTRPSCQDSPTKINAMMTKKEQEFLASYMTPTTRYFEWGSGGSTDTYGRLTEGLVVSVENFRPWCDKVASLPFVKCRQKNKSLEYKCIIPHATGPAGYPENKNHSGDFAEYLNAITAHPNFDVVLVDGRWRVACAMISLDYIKDSTVVFMHDVSDAPSRKAYKTVYKWYDVIAQVDTLVAMRRKQDVPRPNKEEIRRWESRPEF